MSREVERSDTSGCPALKGRGTPKGVRERVGLKSDMVGVTRGSAARPGSQALVADIPNTSRQAQRADCSWGTG